MEMIRFDKKRERESLVRVVTKQQQLSQERRRSRGNERHVRGRCSDPRRTEGKQRTVLPRYGRLGTRVSTSRWSGLLYDGSTIVTNSIESRLAKREGRKGSRRRRGRRKRRREVKEVKECKKKGGGGGGYADTRMSEEPTTSKVGVGCLARDRRLSSNERIWSVGSGWLISRALSFYDDE